MFAGCGRQLRTFPKDWTNLRVVDDFEMHSAGRSHFRADDLLELRKLIDLLIKKDYS